MSRAGKKLNIVSILLTIGIIYGVWTGLNWGKMSWAKMSVKGVVERVSFDIRDGVSQSKAEALLKQELIGLDWDYDSNCRSDSWLCCRFNEASNAKQLECNFWDYWTLPIFGKTVDVEYTVHKVITNDGLVYDYSEWAGG